MCHICEANCRRRHAHFALPQTSHCNTNATSFVNRARVVPRRARRSIPCGTIDDVLNSSRNECVRAVVVTEWMALIQVPWRTHICMPVFHPCSDSVAEYWWRRRCRRRLNESESDCRLGTFVLSLGAHTRSLCLHLSCRTAHRVLCHSDTFQTRANVNLGCDGKCSFNFLRAPSGISLLCAVRKAFGFLSKVWWFFRAAVTIVQCPHETIENICHSTQHLTWIRFFFSTFPSLPRERTLIDIQCLHFILQLIWETLPHIASRLQICRYSVSEWQSIGMREIVGLSPVDGWGGSTASAVTCDDGWFYYCHWEHIPPTMGTGRSLLPPQLAKVLNTEGNQPGEKRNTPDGSLLIR